MLAQQTDEERKADVISAGRSGWIGDRRGKL
jgi:hypothetical protein